MEVEAAKFLTLQGVEKKQSSVENPSSNSCLCVRFCRKKFICLCLSMLAIIAFLKVLSILLTRKYDYLLVEFLAEFNLFNKTLLNVLHYNETSENNF